MQETPLILSALTAVVVFLFFMGVSHFSSSRETTRQRLKRMAQQQEENRAFNAAGRGEDTPLRFEQENSELAKLCDGILKMFGVNTERFRRKEQLRFYRSGIYSIDAPIYYLFFKRIGVVILVIIAALLAFHGNALTGTQRLLFYFMAAMCAGAGILGPDMVLKNQRLKREKVIQNSFPDMLDLLLVCVESGLALDGALARVCRELGKAHPEITQELNRTRLELTLLNDRTQALLNLAERTDLLSFRSLVTTLMQSERFGTSLTDTLRVLSEDQRNTRLMIAEDKAGRLPVLMTIPLIVMMMPAFFLIVLGPSIIKLLDILHSQ